MPSPSVDSYSLRKREEKTRKKSGTGGKMLSVFLEHTRCYIPLKKNSPTVELKRPVSCSRRYAEVGGKQKNYRGDAFLEPYMQGLSNEVNHTIDEVFDGSSNVFKKRLQRDEDRTSSFSSPVDSVDTPLDEKSESHFRLIEVNAGSQGSLNQLISGDDCSESSSVNSSLAGDEETPCDITLLERLIRSHPIWFLPGIQRAGAFHLLQGKEDGNFVVRQSSQNSTMAISVRLPNGKGPYIEHYLIQASDDGQIGLESSDNRFSGIPLLIAHYCQCCDELPVQLTLPRAIREARNRQQLTSLALLGQEFWRYPMANPRQSIKSEDESPQSLPNASSKESTPQVQNTPFLGSSSSNSPASSLSSFESSNNNNNSSCSALEQPSLTFDLDVGAQLADECSSPNSLMTTFKGSPQFSSVPYNQIGIPLSPESPSSLPVETSHSQAVCVRRPRPTPPNTLNLMSTTTSTISCQTDTSVVQNQLVTPPSNKTPPPPPPRWTKPCSLASNAGGTAQQNFTVTTTLTFTVNKETSPTAPDLKVACFRVSPAEKVERHITSAQMIQATSLTASLPTIVPTPLPRSHIPHVTSPSQTSQVLSPVSEGNTRPFHRRHRRHNKESYHYQESDIIESYHRSAVADKASDYEDIWGPDSSLSTFKPQPPPRSLPFSSLDDFSTAKVFKKTSTGSLQQEMEKQTSTPSGTPTPEPVVNKNRFGLVLDVCGNEVVALSPIADAVAPVTPVQESKASTPEASTPAEPKLGSPFYAEPADAITQAALKRRAKPPTFTSQPSIRNRHSDPTSSHQWPPAVAGGGVLERIDSKEELITNGSFSSSVDNLFGPRKSRRSNGSIAAPAKNAVKPVEPPKIGPTKTKYNDATWAVDSSWEFLAKEDMEDEDAKSDKNLIVESVAREGDDETEPENSSNRCLTVQEMIAKRLPKFRLSPVFPKKNSDTDEKNVSDRLPSLDNSNGSASANDTNNNSDKVVYHNGFSVLSQISDTSDTQTEFSEPWDSSQWEHLLNKSYDATADDETAAQVNRCKSFKERLDPLLSPPRLQALARTRVTGTTPGATVRNYALKLAADKDTVFAQTIDNFIACTIESKETKPVVVMRNMRQFMSGMKNYLVTHGEREFIKEVERERSKLKSTEFLNLDAILEGVMHKLVISPLKEHLKNLFINEYTENGAIELLGDNIMHARTKPPFELGIRERLVLPSEDDIEKIHSLFKQMQVADSPLEKLELLLSAIAIIFHSVKVSNSGPESVFLGADDFLPIFVWVLVRTGMVAAEIEAEYMWGLLHPSLLSGEGGYYLTTLSSAVNVLKNFRPVDENSITRLSWCHDPLSEFRSILKVVVPDEMNGSLLTKTLPVRPNMTTRDICKIIALKLRITNPQDYSLFKLVDGEETLLNDTECPQDVKCAITKAGKHCIFAYKRLDAKIAWPTTTTTQTVKL